MVHELTPVPQAPHVVQGLMNLRGLILTAIDLRRRMELPDREASDTTASIVVRADDGPVSLLVDRIGDVVDVGPESFEPAPDAAPGSVMEFITGAYKLEDVLLLELDTKRVIADPTALAG
ncbi:MAG: chemotaxis protein CheW [Ilumatobacteraceae bacterium]